MTAQDGLWFLDSNVLLYRYDSVSPGKQAEAKRWLDALGDAEAARLSWQVLNELYDNLTHKMRIPRLFARNAVALYADWDPIGFNLGLAQRAWQWEERAQLRYWDALIVAAAEALGCRYLLSEDFQHGCTYGTVRVINPFAVEP
jgi:predicted nucleic acid-binding protein